MKRRTNDVAEKMKNARRMLRGIEPTPKGVKHTVEGLKPLEEAEASLERGEIGLGIRVRALLKPDSVVPSPMLQAIDEGRQSVSPYQQALAEENRIGERMTAEEAAIIAEMAAEETVERIKMRRRKS